MEAREPKPKRRPRVSLLSLLLLLTTVAACVSAYRTWVENAAVKRDIADIRNRLTSLDYDDDRQGHARMINGQVEEPTFFRWQVYTPKAIPSQLVLEQGSDRTALPLPGGVCAVQISCSESGDGGGAYAIVIEPTALGVGGFQPNRDASGQARLTTAEAPPWIEHGLAEAQLDCLGPWPLPEGEIGVEQPWDASQAVVLLQSWVRGKRINLGVRFAVEPVTAAPAVR